MVVVGVDKGDVEASGVEKLGYFQHGVDVALCWIRYANCMSVR